MGDVTRNFSRHELDVHEPFPAAYAGNVVPLLERAQWLRDLAGSPGYITSAYRSPARNASIPGASGTSQHMRGEALDVYFPLAPFRELAAAALAAVRTGQAPAFGQLIAYPVEGHFHVSLPTLGERDGQVLRNTGPDQYAALTSAGQLPKLSAAQRRGGVQAALVGVALLVVFWALWRELRRGGLNG